MIVKTMKTASFHARQSTLLTQQSTKINFYEHCKQIQQWITLFFVQQKIIFQCVVLTHWSINIHQCDIHRRYRMLMWCLLWKQSRVASEIWFSTFLSIGHALVESYKIDKITTFFPIINVLFSRLDRTKIHNF